MDRTRTHAHLSTASRPRRRHRFAVAILATTLAAAGVTATSTPVAADTTGPAIAHAPVATAAYGHPISIAASSTCPVGAACSARLYYRTTTPAALAAVPGVVNEGGFSIVGLTRGAATTVDSQEAVEWQGVIPGAAVTSRGVDYYLEADQNGTRTVFPGSTTATTVQPSGTYQHVHVLNPPLLNHVPVPTAVADQPITVEAQVSCSSGGCGATLHYRETPATLSPDTGWASVAMQQQGAGTPLGGAATLLTFRADVPASSVDTSGVDYYLQATDGQTQAFHPGTVYEGYYAPRDGARVNTVHHHVHVAEPPRLAHVPVATAPFGEDIRIAAEANCPSTRQCQGMLYYRTTTPGTVSASSFASAPMTVTRPVGAAGVDIVLVEGNVPAAVVDTRGVDYYFAVTDGTTTSWWPGTSAADAPGVWVDGMRVLYHHVRVQEPPHLTHVPPTIAQALQDLAIESELTCATATCTVNLHYSTTPNTAGTYQTVAMSRVSVAATTSASRVELWRGTIPASQVTTRGLAYHLTATDGYTNTSAPGIFYWGAYQTVDGTSVAPETARFVVRVVDPPHPVHAPVGAAFTGEPLAFEAMSNCATGSCRATLQWRVTGQGWQTTSMSAAAPSSLAYGNTLIAYRAVVAGSSVTPAGLEYRIEVTDSYVTETTPAYPVVVTQRPNPGSQGTVTTFVPPVGQGAIDSDVPLVLKAVWADGTAFDGPVRWCVQALGAASTGCLSSGTVQAAGGNAAFSVRPTEANATLRVTAYADGLDPGTQAATELSGGAVVAGVSPPSPPEATTVAFTPPAARTDEGTSVSLSFKALRRDGSAFTGPVRWSQGPPGSAPSYGDTAFADSDGMGTVAVAPTSSTPVIQVFAYADSPSAGVFGVQDVTEATGSAVAVGTPVPTGPGGTELAFTPPVGAGATDSSVRLDFRATNLDGSPFWGTVRYSVRPVGSLPVYDRTTSAGGSGSILVTPTADSQVLQVMAYADAGTFGVQDPTEGTGAAAVVNTTPPPPPPPPTPGTELVFTTPVATAPPNAFVNIRFKAVNYDGSNFTGTVHYGSGPSGSMPAFSSTAQADAAGEGFVTVRAGASPVTAVAYADRTSSGRAGTRDESEIPGTALVVGATL